MDAFAGSPCRALDPELIARLEEAAGPRAWTEDPDEIEPSLADQRGRWRGVSRLLLRPASTEAVARVLALCNREGVAVVPQGGNTGLVGGSIPDGSGNEVLLSLARLDRVRAVDAANHTITVEAGCILADVQAAAAAAGRLFPLSLASEGSCRIGGNLSTNAGGTQVLRYGNARELVLGLEVVLADGRVWDGLRALRKDNTGYDLRQLFVGAEGTLGVITAAVLKLFPAPRSTATALAAVCDPSAAVRVLHRCRAATGDGVTGFEYMNRASFAVAVDHTPGLRDPLAERAEHYALIETSSGADEDRARSVLESALAAAMEAGDVLDAAVARSGAQAGDLWRIRESIPGAQKQIGASLKHDVSVPVSRIPEFLERAAPLVEACIPGGVVVAFGHVGDGNVHYNVSQPPGMPKPDFMALEDGVHHEVYELVAALGGSFSAEHGVGRIKRAELLRYRPAVEIAMMRALKAALDPRGILNPGVLL